MIASVVPVLGEQRLQFERRFGEAGDRERDVLDDDGGAGAAHRADRREEALADVPEPREFGRVVVNASGLDRRDAGEGARRSPAICAASAAASGARVSTSSAATVRAEALGYVRHPGLVLDGAQRRAVHQFHRVHRRRFSAVTARHAVSMSAKSISALALCGCSGTVRYVISAMKPERPLRADHQVLEDVDRVVEVDQRVQAVAGGVLHPELPADPLGQRRVVSHPRRQCVERASSIAPLCGGTRARLAGRPCPGRFRRRE